MATAVMQPQPLLTASSMPSSMVNVPQSAVMMPPGTSMSSGSSIPGSMVLAQPGSTKLPALAVEPVAAPPSSTMLPVAGSAVLASRGAAAPSLPGSAAISNAILPAPVPPVGSAVLVPPTTARGGSVGVLPGTSAPGPPSTSAFAIPVVPVSGTMRSPILTPLTDSRALAPGASVTTAVSPVQPAQAMAAQAAALFDSLDRNHDGVLTRNELFGAMQKQQMQAATAVLQPLSAALPPAAGQTPPSAPATPSPVQRSVPLPLPLPAQTQPHASQSTNASLFPTLPAPPKAAAAATSATAATAAGHVAAGPPPPPGHAVATSSHAPVQAVSGEAQQMAQWYDSLVASSGGTQLTRADFEKAARKGKLPPPPAANGSEITAPAPVHVPATMLHANQVPATMLASQVPATTHANQVPATTHANQVPATMHANQVPATVVHTNQPMVQQDSPQLQAKNTAMEEQRQQQQQLTMQQQFDMLDTNHDGALSPQEYVAGQETFQKRAMTSALLDVKTQLRQMQTGHLWDMWPQGGGGLQKQPMGPSAGDWNLQRQHMMPGAWDPYAMPLGFGNGYGSSVAFGAAPTGGLPLPGQRPQPPYGWAPNGMPVTGPGQGPQPPYGLAPSGMLVTGPGQGPHPPYGLAPNGMPVTGPGQGPHPPYGLAPNGMPATAMNYM